MSGTGETLDRARTRAASAAPSPAATPSPLLIIACGALSHEIVALKRLNGWEHVVVQCLAADLHNRPALIPEAVREKIARARPHFERMFVAYADCGTGGLLDEVLRDEGVERLPGAHCYEFFAGSRRFAALSDEQPGTLYLTDFLARHFDRLIIHGLGIDRHPELQGEYFRHYHRVVYLAQNPTDELKQRARAAADRLNLEYQFVPTGYGELAVSLRRLNAPRNETTPAC
ncbi:MAG: DUF1638 domain-containing protein [Gammaproteobacteria bacterium]